MNHQSTGLRSERASGKSGALRRIQRRLHTNRATSLATKAVVTTVGAVLIAVGVAMLVAPGPGIVMIAVGLAVLATEWQWAERWLHAVRRKAHEARLRARSMDPRVRRRRLLLTALAVGLLAAALAGYVAVYGWPWLAVSGWDRAQNVASWLPELPGM